jgi:hypothetical protein
MWMPDGRSLCDRRAHPGYPATVEESLAVAIEVETIAACGACAFLVHMMRGQVVTDEGTSVGYWPATTKEAVASLRGTRWAADLDLDSLDVELPLEGMAANGLGAESIRASVRRQRDRQARHVGELRALLRTEQDSSKAPEESS